jgi:hypothetical protein
MEFTILSTSQARSRGSREEQRTIEKAILPYILITPATLIATFHQGLMSNSVLANTRVIQVQILICKPAIPTSASGRESGGLGGSGKDFAK